jgi:branched-chain amino acid transport system ATP-binding protein
MLQIRNLDVFYDDVQVLDDVSMDVNEGELVAVIGANGAGKTTLLRTISGLKKPHRGSITFAEQRISDIDAYKVVSAGIVQVPEGRLLFSEMTVNENLEMGGYTLTSKVDLKEHKESVYEMFPVLKERAMQTAGTLSGGEQQMLAIGRALMSSPKLIMFDEPSLGLGPKLVQQIFKLILQIHENLTVLLVEQNVRHSCEISDRAFVLENGKIALQGTGSDMLENDHVRKAYLGL